MYRTTTGLRSSRRRNVEIAATALIRSVLAPAWSASAAGAALCARVHGDRNILLILRARSVRELSRGWTPLGHRVAATVDAALTLQGASATRPATAATLEASAPDLAGTAA